MGTRVSFSKNHGFALAEVLAAMALFLILAVAASSYFSKSKDFSMKIEGAASCRSQAESLLGQFKDGTNIPITNYIPGADVPGTRTLASVATEQDYSTLVTSTTQYRNYQNIENATTRAYLLLSSNSNYCTQTNGVVVDSTNKSKIFQNVSVVNDIMAQGKTISFKIEPFNIPTQTALSCSDVSNVSPLSTANNAHEKALALELRIANSNNTEVCTGSAILKYNLDNRRPTSAGNTLAAQNCGLAGNALSDEPGSMFICSLDNASFALCDNSHVGSLGLPLYSSYELQNGGPGRTNTVAFLGIGGFPDNGNTVTTTPVYIKAVDSSGNREAASTTVNVPCCVDSAWVENPPGAAGTCVGSTVGTTSNCGNAGADVAGTKCGAGCPTTTNCEYPDLVTRSNCGAVMSTVANGCIDSPPCLSTSSCDGGGNMVTRDCNNVITSTVPDPVNCAVACTPSPSSYCSGTHWVNDDGCGSIVDTGCNSTCGANSSICQGPSGLDRVTRDVCGTVLSTVLNDPTCSLVPHFYRVGMMCGTRGCSGTAHVAANSFISLLGTVPMLNTAGIQASIDNFTPALNATINSCINGGGWGGSTSDSGSSGGISWNFTADQMEDAYTNPYRTQFAACSIVYTIWW